MTKHHTVANVKQNYEHYMEHKVSLSDQEKFVAETNLADLHLEELSLGQQHLEVLGVEELCAWFSSVKTQQRTLDLSHQSVTPYKLLLGYKITVYRRKPGAWCCRCDNIPSTHLVSVHLGVRLRAESLSQAGLRGAALGHQDRGLGGTPLLWHVCGHAGRMERRRVGAG